MADCVEMNNTKGKKEETAMSATGSSFHRGTLVLTGDVGGELDGKQ